MTSAAAIQGLSAMANRIHTGVVPFCWWHYNHKGLASCLLQVNICWMNFSLRAISHAGCKGSSLLYARSLEQMLQLTFPSLPS